MFWSLAKKMTKPKTQFLFLASSSFEPFYNLAPVDLIHPKQKVHRRIGRVFIGLTFIGHNHWSTKKRSLIG